jgi:hypothetical protein
MASHLRWACGNAEGGRSQQSARRSIFLNRLIEPCQRPRNCRDHAHAGDTVDCDAVDNNHCAAGLGSSTWHPDHLSDVGRLSARYDEIGDLDLHRLIILV